MNLPPPSASKLWLPPATTATTATTAAAAESSGCALEVWDRSRFQGERDWMVLADGESVDDARNWLRWDGAEGAGHLYSISTHGYVNFRPPDFVRGHGDHGGKGAKGAPQGPGTLVQLQCVDGGDASAAAAEALAADAGEGGAPPLGARAANDKHGARRRAAPSDSSLSARGGTHTSTRPAGCRRSARRARRPTSTAPSTASACRRSPAALRCARD